VFRSFWFCVVFSSTLTIGGVKAQNVKKNTVLIVPRNKIALIAAETKNVRGVGNGFGSQILKGVAASSGKLPPDANAPADDAAADGEALNNDAAIGSFVTQGDPCYVDVRNKLVVLGNDRDRVLVELRDKPYGGPQLVRSGDVFNPTTSNGALELQSREAVPPWVIRACLNKMKLWIDRDVFVALQTLDVPPDPKTIAKQKDEENKTAVQRALQNK